MHGTDLDVENQAPSPSALALERRRQRYATTVRRSAPTTSRVASPADVAAPLAQPFSRAAIRTRRGLDIVVAGPTLLLALPLMLLVGLMVLLTSRGPVLFRQQHVGLNGKLFTMWKFRTMRNHTDDLVASNAELRLAYIANDYKLPCGSAQITKLGGVLRKLSLDEMPQLFNVLAGRMSIVGVRPIELAQFESRSPASRALYGELRPGITGLWQVEGRSSVQHIDRVRLDDRYIRTWSVVQDVRILVRTPLCLMRSHHAG